MGGNYIEFNINRDEISRYGLRVGDVQEVLEVALGGMPLTTTVEGLERYTVNLRYDRDFRENLEALREIIVPTPAGAQVPLGQLAEVKTVRAPMGIKSENAVPNAWIYVDVKGIDIGTYVQMAQRALNEAIARGTVKLPSGYNIFWSGQYEYMLRAQQRLSSSHRQLPSPICCTRRRSCRRTTRCLAHACPSLNSRLGCGIRIFRLLQRARQRASTRLCTARSIRR